MTTNKPPVFNTWGQLYALVLFIHILVILGMLLLMKIFGAS